MEVTTVPKAVREVNMFPKRKQRTLEARILTRKTPPKKTLMRRKLQPSSQRLTLRRLKNMTLLPLAVTVTSTAMPCTTSAEKTTLSVLLCSTVTSEISSALLT